MKKIWIYLLGVLTGIIVTILFLAVIAAMMNVSNDPAAKMTNGMTFFENPGETVESSSVRVFQALGDGAALAECKGDGDYIYMGPHVLLYNEDGTPYYDEQVVNAPCGKSFKQVGIYRYSAKSGIDKTVPIVKLLDI